jgi:DNA-binding transcriptional regulator YhcF (GntR family)
MATSASHVISLAERRTGVPARTQVYAALRDAIIRAELEPGRRLSENELAARFGVSRTPIREALVRLRDERLVAIVPQYGTFVSQISPQAVSDAQFLREALECAAIREAATLATEDDIALLEENLRAQERAEERGDFDAAIAEYRREIDLHPRSYMAQFNLGKLYERLGNAAEQRAAYAAAVHSNPDFAEGFLFLAKAYLDNGQLVEAEHSARQGVLLKPTGEYAPLGYFVMSDVYARQGRANDAARAAAEGHRASDLDANLLKLAVDAAEVVRALDIFRSCRKAVRVQHERDNVQHLPFGQRPGTVGGHRRENAAVERAGRLVVP